MSIPPKPLIYFETIYKDDPAAPCAKNGYSVEVVYRRMSTEEDTITSKQNSISLHSQPENCQGNSLFIFGGARTPLFYNSVHLFGVESKCWEQVEAENPPEPTAWQRSVLIPETNSIFVFGGYNGTIQNNHLFEFHLETKKWSKVEPMGSSKLPKGRNDPSLCVRKFGIAIQLVVIGGFHNKYLHLNDMWSFDLNTTEWSPLPCSNPIEPRSGHCAVYMKQHDRILLHGGYGNETFFGNFLEYDFQKNCWTCIKKTTLYRRGHTMKPSPIDSNVFLIVGGKDESFHHNNTMHLFFYFERLLINIETVHISEGIAPFAIPFILPKIENHHCITMYTKKSNQTPFLLFGGTNKQYLNQLLKVTLFHGEYLFISSLKSLQQQNIYTDVQFVLLNTTTTTNELYLPTTTLVERIPIFKKRQKRPRPNEVLESSKKRKLSLPTLQRIWEAIQHQHNV